MTTQLPGHSFRGFYSDGKYRCECGAQSDTHLTKQGGREWHRFHKENVQGFIRALVIEAPTPFPYMTSIPDRVPAQKPHAALGQAKKAVLFRLDGYDKLSVDCMVYEWTSTGWKTLWNIKAGTDRKAMPWQITESPKN